jgi:hypothetical protein
MSQDQNYAFVKAIFEQTKKGEIEWEVSSADTIRGRMANDSQLIKVFKAKIENNSRIYLTQKKFPTFHEETEQYYDAIHIELLVFVEDYESESKNILHLTEYDVEKNLLALLSSEVESRNKDAKNFLTAFLAKHKSK